MFSRFRRVLPLLLVILVVTVSFLHISSLTTEKGTNNTDEKILHGTIVKVLEEKKMIFDNREYLSQKLQVAITSGVVKDRIITVDTSLTPKFNKTKYQKDEKILLGYMDGGIDNESYYVISYERTTPLIVLFVIFIALSLIIARKRSFYSLLGMALSLLILIIFVLPAIVNGANPFITSLTGMIVMIPILYYVSHGVNKKTTSAVIGTALTLTITALLSVLFVNTMHLTGITFSEVETLLYLKEGNFDMKGVLLAGILMGALGVIDDVAITQASVVEELYSTDKKMTLRELIGKAMNVGKDHIGSVINTLILVYVGSSLTTLLLFTEFPRPLLVLLNSEVVVIPIVVAIIGSIGLILAIPITTILAAVITTKQVPKKLK